MYLAYSKIDGSPSMDASPSMGVSPSMGMFGPGIMKPFQVEIKTSG